MPGRWMDERDRNREGREGRSESDWRERERWGGREDRSFGVQGARWEGPDRDKVHGEEDTGGAYNTRNQPFVRPGGGGYGAGGAYGGGESYGRGAGGGPDYRQGYGGRGGGAQDFGRGSGQDFGRPPAWQQRDYEGVSPAMRQGEYDAERRAQRFQTQDYTGGGRFYGDDARQPLFREEYGQGGRDYGPSPRGYDAGAGHGGNRALEQRYARDMRQPVSGGTGGYDFEERGYGDGGREERGARAGGGERRDYGRGEWQRPDYQGVSPAMNRGGYDADRGEDRYRFNRDERRDPYDRDRDEGGDRDRGRGGDFFSRVGNWIGSAMGEVRRDLGGEREPRRYSADFAREARWTDPGHRGRGPKGYQRSDDRISDEVHQRLTDDPWVDASNITVSVSAGEVTLSGTVENREAKHRAERAVEEVVGVAHVQNNLRIERGGFFTSPTSGFGDSVMEAKMREDDGKNGGTKSTDDTAATRTTTRRT